jgi:ribonucleotide reductase class II
MWCGGTEWSDKQANYPGMYNCSSTVVDNIETFGYLMDLAMTGCGTGAVLELDAIAKLPSIKTKLNIEIVGDIGTKLKSDRQVETLAQEVLGEVWIEVGDSRRGWVDSYMELIRRATCDGLGESIDIKVDLSSVRSAGERLQGFGGSANPFKLPELYSKVSAILNGAINRQLNSIECCKLIDEAACVVVAGNIRRCIAYGERVSAFGGMKPIQNILVGDRVLASDGEYHSVTNTFDQGIQKTIKIQTQLSSLSVTANHRLAVMDKFNEYKWVEAKYLSVGDILVSTPHTKGIDIITTDEAWLIGTYIADGHTDIENKAKRSGGGGETIFAMSTTSLDTVGAKIAKCLFDKGYTPTIRSKGNSSSLSVYRKDLAEYFRQFKAPWGTPTIPDVVWHGSPQVRGAFLAGLWDGDGDDRAVLNSTKPDFLAEVQKLYLSLGIAVNLNIRKDKVVKGNTYEGCHNLTVVGQQSKLALKALVAPFLVRIDYVPSAMNRSNLRLPKFFSTKHMHGKAGHNWDGFVADGIADASLIPCPIVSISEGEAVHTYDIEVADVHEFIVNGLLSHNSAGIRQFSANDTFALTAKDNLWQQRDDGKWGIDPDRDALRMANHTRVFHTKPTLTECIDSVRKQYYSGEGAIQWAGEAVARANADLLDTPEKKHNFLHLYNLDKLNAKVYLSNMMGLCEDIENIGSSSNFELNHRMARYGLNPCGEIQMTDNFCNLAEVHLNTIDPFDFDAQVSAFKAASLNVVALLHHQFEVPRYQKSRELDPIVGVSFTGLFDFFVQLFGVEWLHWWQAGRPANWGHPVDIDDNCRMLPLLECDFIRVHHFDSTSDLFLAIEEEYLCSWKTIVFDTVTEYCERHGLKVPNRATTCQPAGSKSLLTGASPGWHPPKASRYIRRMTFGKDEPIALAAIDMGYNVIPSQSDKDENGNLLDDIHDPRVTEWLVEIPCATSWADLPGADEIEIGKFSALAQFNFYMQVQRYYSTHTTSATIEMREDEITELATAIYEDIQADGGYMSAALLARFDSLETFPRMPFEPISKDGYNDAMVAIRMRRTIDNFDEALALYDQGQTNESGPSGCDSDKCLIPEPK